MKVTGMITNTAVSCDALKWQCLHPHIDQNFAFTSRWCRTKPKYVSKVNCKKDKCISLMLRKVIGCGTRSVNVKPETMIFSLKEIS